MSYYPDPYVDYTYAFFPSFLHFLLPLAAVFLSIVGGIALYFLFARHENRFHGAAARLHDLLTFRTFFSEHLLHMLYCIAVMSIAVSSVILLFSNFLLAVLLFVLGNLIARLVFEGALLLFTLCRNVREINRKMGPLPEDNTPPAPPQPETPPVQPAPAPVQPEQPPVPPQDADAQPPQP